MQRRAYVGRSRLQEKAHNDTEIRTKTFGTFIWKDLLRKGGQELERKQALQKSRRLHGDQYSHTAVFTKAPVLLPNRLSVFHSEPFRSGSR